MEERLQKIISRHGAASRRQAEVLLAEGRVRVNGNTAKLGDTADEAEDVIEVDGVRLKKAPPRLCILLNKPRGYVTTLQDEKGRKNVSELVNDCGYSSTGQVYHHLKPLLTADLVTEDKSHRGTYIIQPHRVQGLIMLLAGIADLVDGTYTQGQME